MRLTLALYFVLGFGGMKCWVGYDAGMRGREAFAESMNANNPEGTAFFWSRGRTLVIEVAPDERLSADTDAYVDFMRNDKISRGELLKAGFDRIEAGTSKAKL